MMSSKSKTAENPDEARKPEPPEAGQARKKVLIITYYWPPSGGAGVQRFLKFVKYFRDFGVDPVVLTCKNPTYPILDPTLSADIPANIPVYRARTIEPFGIYSRIARTTPDQAANPATILDIRNLNLPQRMARWLRANIFIPDARIGWVPFALKKARKLIRQHDIDTVVTTGPPHSTHFIGLRLKRGTAIRWIADFRDPWTDIHYNRALPRTAFTRRCDASMEIKVLREADEITVTAPGTGQYFSHKVKRAYHTIPNGFDPDDFKSLPGQNKPQSNTDVTVPGLTPLFCIRHAGSITETSVPVNLLRVLSRIPESDIRIEFIGSTHPDVQKYAGKFGLGRRIAIHPYVPHARAIELMQESDLNLVVVHRSDDSRILIPGKIYDYLKAGKPIMVIGPPDGDAAAIVQQCQIGMTFDYEADTAIEAWLKLLLEAKSSSGSEEAVAPDSKAISKFSRPSLTHRLSALIYNRPLPELSIKLPSDQQETLDNPPEI